MYYTYEPIKVELWIPVICVLLAVLLLAGSLHSCSGSEPDPDAPETVRETLMNLYRDALIDACKEQ